MANSRKILIVASFLVLLVLVSGFSCSLKKDSGSPISSTSKTGAKKSIEELRTGTEGMSVGFTPNNPPATIYVEENQQNKVDVIVELSNKGAYPQPEDGKPPSGKVFLSGYDQNILEFNPNFYDLGKKSLYGKSLIDIRGGSDIMIFNGDIKDNLKVDKYEPILLATLCYNYQTIAGPPVCIDPDPHPQVKQKKVCEAAPITLTSQGAPVAVVGIDVNALATKTIFTIAIKNVGSGDVIRNKQEGTNPSISSGQSSASTASSNDDAISKCDPFGASKLTREDIDKVFVEGVSTGSTGLLCWGFTDKPTKSEQGFIRLTNGQGSVICELPKQDSGYPGGNTAYTTPLKIVLNYAYKTTVQRSVIIQKENTGKN